MKVYIFIFYIIISFSKIFAHESHYKNLSKIEMDVLRNDKIIGYSNYFFKHNSENMTVENHTKFSVDMFGVKIFSIDSKSKEIYKKGNLTSFVSQTFQNDKLKFVKLNYDKKKNIFIIDGSSYKGEARTDNIIGNWWNPKILNAKTQISPLSGSIKKQSVKLTGKGEIKFKDKKIKLFRYKLKSTEDLPDDKKLDFDILIDSNDGIIFQVKYNRLGSWEYRVKNYE
jgi:hypothetical protein